MKRRRIKSSRKTYRFEITLLALAGAALLISALLALI